MKHLLKHIHQEILYRHLFDYVLLFALAVFFTLGMQYFVGQRSMQFMLVVAFAAVYIVWGIYHHIITGTFKLRVMLEYVLLAFTMIFLSMTLAFP